MIGKSGAVMGQSMIVMIHIFLVTIIAITILGVSGLIYNYEVDTRDSESIIVARNMVDCVTANGILDLDLIEKEDIFSYCGFSGKIDESIFVSLEVKDGEESVEKIIGGNEELIWVKKIYTSGIKTTSIARYEPGYFNGVFPVLALKDGELFNSNLVVEVIVYEEE